MRGIKTRYVFPAPAGINRTPNGGQQRKCCVPRASGDKPSFIAENKLALMCSPRQRG